MIRSPTAAFLARPDRAGRDPGRRTARPDSVEAVADPPDPPSDAHLMQSLQVRDERALATLYDRHSPGVYALLLRLLDPPSAQEVLQDVFLRLWEAPERFDAGRAELRAYLLVMARSRALDRLRQRRGEWRLYDDEGQDFPLPDERQDPFARAADQQQADEVRQAMARLSDVQRETVRRAFLLGESREETARHMGVPVGTVKSRLNTALGALKRRLSVREDHE